jgi:subtilisin family serine protease
VANRLGISIVAAGGNESFNSNGNLASVPSDLPTVISDTATGPRGFITPGGLLTATGTVAAPGGDCGPGYPASCAAPHVILSTYILPNGAAAWAFNAGTSMAAPHVAGVVALLRAQHPELGPGDVRSRVKDTAQNIGDRQVFGHGMVDADAITR